MTILDVSVMTFDRPEAWQWLIQFCILATALLLGNALNLAVVYLCGMVYCYVISNYEQDASATLATVREKTTAPLFNPAMILKNGDAILPVDKIAAQLQYNRQIGTFGESQFWFDGLKIPEVQEIFKAYYSYPIPFPDL